MKIDPTKRRAIIGIAAIILLVMRVSATAKDIKDPVADFLATFERDPSDKLYRLECNFGQNGSELVFLAFSHDIGPDGDCGWTLYLKRKGSYVPATGIDDQGKVEDNLSVTFNVHHYFIGYIPELKRTGLLTLEETNGRDGGIWLTAVIILGHSFKMVDVGLFHPINPPDTSSQDNEKNFNKIKGSILKRFPMPFIPPIEELNPP